MTVYKNGAVSALHRHGGAIQSAYDGDKQYFSSFVPVGTVLWQSSRPRGNWLSSNPDAYVNTESFSGREDLLVADFLPLSVGYDKIGSGIEINFSYYLDYERATGGATRLISDNSRYPKAIYIPKDKLQSRYAFYEIQDPSTPTKIYCELKGNNLLLSTDHEGGNTLVDVSPNSNFEWSYWLLIQSITAAQPLTVTIKYVEKDTGKTVGTYGVAFSKTGTANGVDVMNIADSRDSRGGYIPRSHIPAGYQAYVSGSAVWENLEKAQNAEVGSTLTYWVKPN